MKAVILAGGLGTRLRAVVSDRPKSMAVSAGKPFLEYQVNQLRAEGIDQVIMCVGYMADQIQDYFGDGGRWGLRIEYGVETAPLGTGGAVKNAQRLILGDPTGPFLLLNGDSYLRVDVDEMARSHARHRATDPSTLGTLAAVAADDVSAFGALELATDGRVVAFREKGRSGPGRINGGVYLLETQVLELIPVGRPVSIEKETFPLILSGGGHLYSHPVDGFFVDIGTPEGYRRFDGHLTRDGRRESGTVDGRPAAGDEERGV